MTSTASSAIDMSNTSIANVLDSTIDWSEYSEVDVEDVPGFDGFYGCLLYTSPSPRDATLSRMPSSA